MPGAASAPGTAQGEISNLQSLTAVGSGIHQIFHPVDANGNPTGQQPGFWRKLGGVGATIGDDILRIAAPNLEKMIPGTEGNFQTRLGLQRGVVTNALANDQGVAKTAEDQAHVLQQQGLAIQEQARAYALTHPKPTNGALLYDKNGTPIGYQSGDGSYMGPNDPSLPQGVGDILGAAMRKQPTNAFELWQSQNPKGTAEDYLKLTGEGKVKSLPEQYNEALAAGDHQTAQRILKVIHDTNTQPKIDVHTADASPAGTWTPGFDVNKNPVMFNNKTGEVRPMTGTFAKGGSANPKIGSDEQKRADLAQNMNENIDALEGILQRRPDLFGPVAGRMTQAKSFLGSSDPDVAQLMTIEHQLGMVAQGAHGMRSAQGVESAANSLVNGFKNSPDATRAALESARGSVKTFLADSQNPGQARTDGTQGIKMRAPDGSISTVDPSQVSHFKTLGAQVVQ